MREASKSSKRWGTTCTRTWPSVTTRVASCSWQKITFSRCAELELWQRPWRERFKGTLNRYLYFKLWIFQASQIDRTDVSLWFSLAGVAAKLNHLHMCRGALEVNFTAWVCLTHYGLSSMNTNRRVYPAHPTTGHALRTWWWSPSSWTTTWAASPTASSPLRGIQSIRRQSCTKARWWRTYHAYSFSSVLSPGLQWDAILEGGFERYGFHSPTHWIGVLLLLASAS